MLIRIFGRPHLRNQRGRGRRPSLWTRIARLFGKKNRVRTWRDAR